MREFPRGISQREIHRLTGIDCKMIRFYAKSMPTEIRDRTLMELLRRYPLVYKRGELQLPDAERIFNPSRQTRKILRQAENIGLNAQALCQQFLDKRSREAQKSMWGIVALLPRLPARIVEQAANVPIARQISSSKALWLLGKQLLAQALARFEANTASPLPSSRS